MIGGKTIIQTCFHDFILNALQSLMSNLRSTGPVTALDSGLKFFLPFFARFILHFLNTLLERTQFSSQFCAVFLIFEQVPLGRFYSSRPSSRSQREIVLE